MEEQRQKIGFFFFDEFSCSTRPNTSYSWATKNTRPRVKSNERNRTRLNGLLSIDITTGKEYIKLTPKAKTEDIASYFCELVVDCMKDTPKKENKQFYDQIWITLDNNSTHKQKMQRLLKEKLDLLYQTSNLEKPIQIYFDYTPPYSPDFNLAEYIIRITRQKLLHHLPINTTLEQIQNRLQRFFQNHQLQTPKQIENTLNHILQL